MSRFESLIKNYRLQVLFELPLRVNSDSQLTKFEWLNNENNWLFIIEDGKRMKTYCLDKSPASEVQFANLAESRRCSKLSWNKDGKRMALVIDDRQIFLWDITSNSFSQIKPGSYTQNVDVSSKKSNLGQISLIAWSKITNKLAICYMNGQLVICNLETNNFKDKFIDNGAGVLAQISQIEVSDDVDIFAGITVIFEILVMTFDGEAKFYVQSNSRITHLKFSYPFKNYERAGRTRLGSHSKKPQIKAMSSSLNKVEIIYDLWLSYQTNEDKILFVRIFIDDSDLSDLSSQANFVFEGNSNENGSTLINHFWLNDSQLICCLSNGCIKLLEIKRILSNKETVQYTTSDQVILNITDQSNNSDNQPDGDRIFKTYELRSRPRGTDGERASYSLVALTTYEIYYYELFNLNDSINSKVGLSFERVDDMDLSGSLKKAMMSLDKAIWCFDCSMLAVQLTNGHILVYRTSLQNYIVSSFGSKAAYLSGPSEITILDYKFDSLNESLGSSRGSREPFDDNAQSSIGSPDDETLNNALIIGVELRPSLIAVGHNHLAVALNNRVRYYLVASPGTGHLKSESLLLNEIEYSSIVVDLKLCTHYVAVRFDDGRLKLHALRSSILSPDGATTSPEDQGAQGINVISSQSTTTGTDIDSNERFFPDPGEKISGFGLTEQLFIYCTEDKILNVFSLDTWTHILSLDCSKYLSFPIIKMVSNEKSNKFICILRQIKKRDNNNILNSSIGSNMNIENVCLYDLYRNCLLPMSSSSSLYQKILTSQLNMRNLLDKGIIINQIKFPKPANLFNCIIDALWDSEGRMLVLIEPDKMHVLVIIDYTIEQGKPTVEFVTTVPKASSHRTIYLSQGIVSFQTHLGRVINMILESHDDEIKLNNLEKQIESVKLQLESSNQDYESMILQVTQMKIQYLVSIMSIYSLTKCKQICEHLMSDEQFNINKIKIMDQDESLSNKYSYIDKVLWLHLAARALYTMNLDFALMIYQKHGFSCQAYLLNKHMNIIRSTNSDSKHSLVSAIMDLLECSMI